MSDPRTSKSRPIPAKKQKAALSADKLAEKMRAMYDPKHTAVVHSLSKK